MAKLEDVIKWNRETLIEEYMIIKEFSEELKTEYKKLVVTIEKINEQNKNSDNMLIRENTAFIKENTKLSKENEKLKQALRKCSPFTDHKRGTWCKCEFCKCDATFKKHEKDCEYMTLCGEGGE